MSWAEGKIGGVPTNCWTFIKDVYQSELGIELPEFSHIMVKNIKDIVKTMETATFEPDWKRVDVPIDFAVVAMSKSNFIHHVGIWTEEDRGKVLHSFNGDAIVANTLLQLKRAGFKRIEFYELSPTSHYLQPV